MTAKTYEMDSMNRTDKHLFESLQTLGELIWDRMMEVYDEKVERRELEKVEVRKRIRAAW